MKPVYFELAEHTYQRCSHTLAPDETLEDACHPGFWSGWAPKLQQGDEIRVTPADMSWVARLVVRATSRIEVLVGVESYARFEDATALAAADAPYELVMRGPRKWSVVKKDTREVVKEDMQTRGMAEQWLKNHMASMAR